MTKIRNIFNNGQRFGAKTGVVKVNSFNVCPDTVLAAATAVTLTRAQMNQYDYFTITSGGATNEFDLPDAAEIGEVLTLYAAAAYELRTETDGNDINNDPDVGYAVSLGETIRAYKVNTTDWLVTSLSSAGAAVTVNATIAP